MYQINNDTALAECKTAAAATGAAAGSAKFYTNECMQNIEGRKSAVRFDATSMNNASSIEEMSSLDIVNAGLESKHWPNKSCNEGSCRFPRLEDCAHFHYGRVQLGSLSLQLIDDKSAQQCSISSQMSFCAENISTDNIRVASTDTTTSTAARKEYNFTPAGYSFYIKVYPHASEPYLIKRSFENFQMLDEMLHRCVYDRKISRLCNLQELTVKNEEELESIIANYLEMFSRIVTDSLTCGTILTWLQLDNKGHRLPLADSETQRTINTPAVGAAYGVRRYQAQASDEISVEVGDMISVIDMPSPAESVWWRGKKSHSLKTQYEVGFFPQSCVAIIGEKIPRNFPKLPPLISQDVTPTKPVLRKHGKLITFFRSFILSRPSCRHLKQSGIYRERVFACDLSEHLLNSGQDIPMVLKSCSQFIENYGIIDGIYRLSGITSNIQRLRSAFDEERLPDLGNPEMKQDIHAVSSLLKMYFRELPNPLCTYQLYDKFVEAIQTVDGETERLQLMRNTVFKLPPPHFRTLMYLVRHLNKVSQHHERTGMTDKNLAIVWAPNLLRSPTLESGGVAALRGVGVQAVVTEYLIRNCDLIFEDSGNARSSRGHLIQKAEAQAYTECTSIPIETHHHESSGLIERPKSLGANGGHKLISLEEAQERHWRVDNHELVQARCSHAVTSNPPNIGTYIEVGGGPSSLPDKYHTVITVPRNWQKRKTHSWKSIFSRSQRVSQNNELNATRKGSRSCKEESFKPEPSKNDVQISFACTSPTSISNRTKIELLDCGKPKCSNVPEAHMTKPQRTLSVRANSIDSFRTIGHSRSVSHDSYFDLLQSPQRGHVIGSCLSRELSELGLNFDREEFEMRFFSESESLVSSPRIGKENVPPAPDATCRKILRARPEEFSSQGNSVNPSPKKQPRLNLKLPSKNTIDLKSNEVYAERTNDIFNNSELNAANPLTKLEKEISNIQYIDCATPEHVNINSDKVIIRSHVLGSEPKSDYDSTERVRYSYPSSKVLYKRNDKLCNEPTATPTERFSFPAILLKNDSTDDFEIGFPQNVLSIDCSNTFKNEDDKSNFEHTKMRSPMHSPRYSLLSSDNSSAVNTPQNELTSFLATAEESAALIKSAEAEINVGNEVNSLAKNISLKQVSQHTTEMSNATVKRKIQNKKWDLTLNLQRTNKMAQFAEATAGTDDIESNIPVKQLLASPSKSNYTDNTSQSATPTPSEYGYQHLQQSSVRSLIDAESSTSSDEKEPLCNELNVPFAEPALITFENDDYVQNDNIYDKVKQFKNTIFEVNKLVNLCQNSNEYAVVPTTHCKQGIDKQLYKNVDMRRPESIYENIIGATMKTKSKDYCKDAITSADKLKAGIAISGIETTANLKPLKSMSVKALATKFENPPLKQHAPPFQQNNKCKTASTIKSYNIEESVRKANICTKEHAENLNKTQQLTRSLDENAFKREFGNRRSVDIRDIHRQSALACTEEHKNRRKSFDNMIPKTLNLPKTLPHMPISENVCANKCHRSIDIEHNSNANEAATATNQDTLLQNLQSSSISPTAATINSNESNEFGGTSLNAKEVLSSVKLDRERIDRYKKERRQQLSEKYNAELLKSRSKIELNSNSKDYDDVSKYAQTSLRVKSKSRGDVYSIQDLEDNRKHYSLTAFGDDHHSIYQKLNFKQNSDSDQMNQNSNNGSNCHFAASVNKQQQQSTETDSIANVEQKCQNAAKQFSENKNKFQERRSHFNSNRGAAEQDRISPSFSIKDVAAIFEAQTHK